MSPLALSYHIIFIISIFYLVLFTVKLFRKPYDLASWVFSPFAILIVILSIAIIIFRSFFIYQQDDGKFLVVQTDAGEFISVEYIIQPRWSGTYKFQPSQIHYQQDIYLEGCELCQLNNFRFVHNIKFKDINSFLTNYSSLQKILYTPMGISRAAKYYVNTFFPSLAYEYRQKLSSYMNMPNKNAHKIDKVKKEITYRLNAALSEVGLIVELDQERSTYVSARVY